MKMPGVLWGVMSLILVSQGVQVYAQDADSLVPENRRLPVVGMTTAKGSNGVTGMTTRGLRASRMVSAEVYNNEGEVIGKIDDLIVDSGAIINVAVLSVGGFLGMGRHLIAIPTLALYIDDQGRVVLPEGSKEKLRSMRAFKYLD
jgi:hypothetical protein